MIRGGWLIDVGDKSDPDDDLNEGEEYLDLIIMYSLKNEEITKASMKNGFFGWASNAVELLFEQHREEAILNMMK